MTETAIKEAAKAVAKPQPATLATGLFGRKSFLRKTEPNALERLRQLASDSKN